LNSRGGQALVESMLLLFPLMLILFVGFGHLHDLTLRDLSHVRALRQATLMRDRAGAHSIRTLREELTMDLIDYKVLDNPQRSGADGLDRALDLPGALLDGMYRRTEVTLTFRSAGLAGSDIMSRPRSFTGVVLAPGTMRRRSREVAVMLGAGAGLAKGTKIK